MEHSVLLSSPYKEAGDLATAAPRCRTPGSGSAPDACGARRRRGLKACREGCRPVFAYAPGRCVRWVSPNGAERRDPGAVGVPDENTRPEHGGCPRSRRLRCGGVRAVGVPDRAARIAPPGSRRGPRAAHAVGVPVHGPGLRWVCGGCPRSRSVGVPAHARSRPRSRSPRSRPRARKFEAHHESSPPAGEADGNGRIKRRESALIEQDAAAASDR